MAGALRRAGVAAALPALVGASTLLHWIAGHRLQGLWIMPDEAIYASRALALWRHGSLPLKAGYGIVYPVVGFPLASGDVSRGYASLKLLQALVMSLAAVPVYAYGRHLMPRAYALLAAALTVASPLLLYSGLVMTEVAFYPIATLALLAVARAVATATRRDQAVAVVLIAAAVATRLQAVVFVAIFAFAIVVDAALARNRSRLRAFWPVWVVLVLVAIAVVTAPGLLGAYSSTIGGGYPIGRSLRLAFDHLALTVVMVAVVPAAAALSLLIDGARGRERDPGARALIAVTLTTVVLVVLQVGFFAARFAPHLLGRDLAALPPLLFLFFALWLARGAPRRLPVAAPAVGSPGTELEFAL